MTITIDSILTHEISIAKKQRTIKASEKADINTLINADLIRAELSKNKTYITENGKSLKLIHGFISKRFNAPDADLLTILNGSPLRSEYELFLNPTLKSSNVDDIIRHQHLKFFILVDLYNSDLISYERFYGHLEQAKITEGNSDTQNQRNGYLLISNKTSFEMTKDTTDFFLKGYKLDAKIELVSLFQKSGIPLLEIPNSYDVNLLVSFLKQIVDLKDTLTLDGFKFNLRLRRIRHFKKSGMYIANAKTIIIDPRNTKTFTHELGHFLFEENINFQLKEAIEKKPQPAISQPKLSKYEKWNKDSEIFAIKFESSI